MIMKKIFKKLIILTMLLGAFSVNAPEITTPNIVQAAKHKTKKTKAKTKSKTKKQAKSTKRKLRRKKVAVHHLIPWANVYIAISKSSPDYQPKIDAINAWNNTKTVKLNIVGSTKNAFIIISNADYGNTGWAGEEQEHITQSKVYSTIHLNDYFLNQVDYKIKVDVAEHELGHSIGLNHYDAGPSVMNPIIDPNHAYSIQPIDIQMVKKLYNEK
jgi:predicted Zn-dependent protease